MTKQTTMDDKSEELLLDVTGECAQCGEVAPLLSGMCEECFN